MKQHVKYSLVTRNLHLIGGVIFIAAFGVGLYMEDLERGPKLFQMIFIHKSIGLAGLMLVIARLLEYTRSNAPQALESHTKLEQTLSKLVKIGLYVIMLGFPITGLMMSWFKGYPAAFFGLFEIAPMVTKDEAIGDVFGAIHHYLVPATFLLLGLHIAGALKHHVIDRDATLKRINPLNS
ncbi:cytochrome b [Terasakiella sp. A23]|uniref:cytochrome b n=1 Tax=Terasakiella sp. FCG-A23 TaxID=3080561 RepID=UPI002954A3F7|nr:cytochrome b [Terasakiella sp. A23]MDV7338640.1 cytochrome b [Terasakiella sp. A23]